MNNTNTYTPRRVALSLLSAAFAVAALSGCSDGAGSTKAEQKPIDSAPLTSSSEPTFPAVEDDPRQCATHISGEDDGSVVDALVEKWLSITLGSSEVVAGTASPADVALSLPLEGKALSDTKRKPTALTLVSFTDQEAKRVGKSADVVCVSGSSEAKEIDGQDGLSVIATADFRVAYTEDGVEKHADGSRRVRFDLVPSTDQQGDLWSIADRASEDVVWLPETETGDQS